MNTYRVTDLSDHAEIAVFEARDGSEAEILYKESVSGKGIVACQLWVRSANGNWLAVK